MFLRKSTIPPWMKHLWSASFIVLLSLVDMGCGTQPVNSEPLQLPTADLIHETGRSSEGLPVTAKVESGLSVGDAITLQLKIINVLDHPYENDFDMNSGHADFFALWLFHGSSEVPRTDAGLEHQRRASTIAAFFVSRNLPKSLLEPGDVAFEKIDLSKLFVVTEPGSYLVIAERGRSGSSDDRVLEAESVKTSFILQPSKR